MKPTRKAHLLALLVTAFLAIGASQASAQVTIAYPDAENTLFTIEVPRSWKLTPMDPASKFFLVQGARGVNMWFRAMPISSEQELEAATNAARKSGREWLSASHDNIVLGDGKFGERDGLTFISIEGTGVAKASGEKVKFVAALAPMKNGAMAQLWAIVPNSAPGGEQSARKVIRSFTPR